VQRQVRVVFGIDPLTPSEQAAAFGAAAFWEPQWRLGYGPLRIAAGVTLVGQEGVVLKGQARLVVKSMGVSFVSVHLPQGVAVEWGGSLTMSKCTSTGKVIQVESGARLVMEDCHIYGSAVQAALYNFVGGVDCDPVRLGDGVHCSGTMVATRCTFAQNGRHGVAVSRGGQVELVKCAIRKNGGHGVSVSAALGGATAVLRGGTSSENAQHGTFAHSGANITVAEAEEEDTEQFVSKGNTLEDWASDGNPRNQIAGLAAGIPVVAV